MAVNNRTFAVIGGASDWPSMPGFDAAQAFANSAKDIRSYLTDPNLLALPEENVLWLFNAEGAVAQLTQILEFLKARLAALLAPRGQGVMVIFAYVGHGAFFGASREYCLLLRDTCPPIEAETSLRVSSLARLLREVAPASARVLILDCCFAGQAAQSFYMGSLDEVVNVKADEIVETEADAGVALLCAASARNPARLDGPSSWTLFGHSLVHVLRAGDPTITGRLSLRRVCGLVQRHLRETAGDEAPRPEVHAPSQEHGDLAGVPLFPNPTSISGGAIVPHPPRLETSPSPEIAENPAEERQFEVRPQEGTIDPDDILSAFTRRVHLWDVALTSDNRRVLAGGSDNAAHLWEWETGEETRTFKSRKAVAAWYTPRGHTDEVLAVAVSPDDRLVVSGGKDGLICLWNIEIDENPIASYPGHTGHVRTVAFSLDGNSILSGGSDGTVRAWDIDSGSERYVFNGATGGVTSVALSLDGTQILVAGAKGTLLLVDALRGDEIRSFEGHRGVVRDATFSADGARVLSGGDDMTLRLWEVAAGKAPIVLRGHTHPILAVALSQDGRYALAGSQDATLWVWNLERRKEIDRFQGHKSMITSVAFSRDDRHALSSSYDGSIRLWKLPLLST